MPQVPVAERRERARRLREAGAQALARFLQSQIGKDVSALIEEPGSGRSEHFAPIDAPTGLTPGSIARLRVVAAAPDRLIGARPTGAMAGASFPLGAETA
jgi:threonylcarbamoyladenosine tRNA methylthiotransferase MtaB